MAQTAANLSHLLLMAQLQAEKCELAPARDTYARAFEMARKRGNIRITMEALAGLLRLASEASDQDAVNRLEKKLDSLMRSHPTDVPPMTWYCKGAIARHSNDPKLARKWFLRYLREVNKEADSPAKTEAVARGWIMLATCAYQRNRFERAYGICQSLLRRYENQNIRGASGMIHLLTGNVLEKRKKYDEALKHFHQADARFLGEHSWYYHLYVLYAYARIARRQQNYTQSYLYLDLIDRATVRAEFGALRKEVAMERERLERDAVDLLIDSRQCVIHTRESGQISLRKQYVLLHILEALTTAHRRDGEQARGLSKAEIIEHVWKERYRPDAHDNKLYYNINRLRKLIEPDVHKPQYLLNWKEGYRLAPGLKIQFLK
jgi:DNA-binding winged helix-turn-helix (wHTH) protein